MKKLVLLVLMLFMTSIFVCGCEALKEKSPEMVGRTEGKAVYKGFDDLPANYTDEDVVAEGGMVCMQTVVTGGKNNWRSFLKMIENQEPAEIRIKQKITDTNAFYRDLIYDGNEFRMIVSVDPEKYDYTFSHLLVLEGRRTEESKRSTIAVLTDDPDLPFEKVIENEVSENRQSMNYQLIYRE